MRGLWIVTFCALLADAALAGEPDPTVTEIHGAAPARVAPGTTAGARPSDALVLFDGRSLDAWEGADGEAPRWQVADGAITVVPGAPNIRTRRAFGDVQLHLEWRAPAAEAHAQNRKQEMAAAIAAKVPARLGLHQFQANSGVFLQSRYEVQVLETYGASTYVNGQAGAIYKQHVPLVTASRPPGQWQSYDIIFAAPRFGSDDQLVAPARMTVLLNSVLIQNNVALWGATEFVGLPRYESHGPAPLELQSHVGISQISYRNIWVREL
jgi:hypothetical protein